MRQRGTTIKLHNELVASDLARATITKGFAPDFTPDFSYYPDEYMRRFKLAEFKLEQVIAAINGGWIPDWTNTKQRKYYPYFDIIEKKETSFSGRGLSLFGVGFGYVNSVVAPCLCYMDEEKCRFAAQNFLSLYEEYYFFKYMAGQPIQPSYKELVESKLSEGQLSEERYKAILEAIG